MDRRIERQPESRSQNLWQWTSEALLSWTRIGAMMSNTLAQAGDDCATSVLPPMPIPGQVLPPFNVSQGKDAAGPAADAGASHGLSWLPDGLFADDNYKIEVPKFTKDK